QAEGDDGDAAQDDQPGQSGVGGAPGLAGAQPAEERGGQAGDVVAEVEDGGQPGAPLDDGGERGAGVLPAEQVGDDLEVGGAADGEELGESLDDSQGEGFGAGHGSSVTGGVQRPAFSPGARKANWGPAGSACSRAGRTTS